MQPVTSHLSQTHRTRGRVKPIAGRGLPCPLDPRTAAESIATQQLRPTTDGSERCDPTCQQPLFPRCLPPAPKRKGTGAAKSLAASLLRSNQVQSEEFALSSNATTMAADVTSVRGMHIVNNSANQRARVLHGRGHSPTSRYRNNRRRYYQEQRHTGRVVPVQTTAKMEEQRARGTKVVSRPPPGARRSTRKKPLGSPRALRAAETKEPRRAAKERCVFSAGSQRGCWFDPQGSREACSAAARTRYRNNHSLRRSELRVRNEGRRTRRRERVRRFLCLLLHFIAVPRATAMWACSRQGPFVKTNGSCSSWSRSQKREELSYLIVFIYRDFKKLS